MSIGSFDFSDVVDEAVERSGGQEATAADIVRIRRGLRLLTERWLSQGFNTWRIEQKQFSASGQSRSVPLPDCVDDVIQVNVLRSGGVETPLMRISPVQYAQLTNKDLQGLPSQYYLDRKESPDLYVFPTGLADGSTSIIAYYVARPEAYNRYGDATDDVPGRWLEAMVSGLALDLARKRPPFNEPLISRLKAEAAEAEDLAQRADRGRQRYRYRINTSRRR